MLYSINRGNVQGYTEGQKWVLHLVFYIEDVVAAGLPYVFTDGHADMEFSEQYTNLDGLSEIDWDLMRSNFWFDINTYPDRCQRRQAEFLVYQLCPWYLARKIGVLNQEVATAVLPHLQIPNQPEIAIQKDWYY